jgi:hypothetical protein
VASDWIRALRARDPFYRITGRDPSLWPPWPVPVGVAALVFGLSLLASAADVWWLPLVVLAVVLIAAEILARRVERRRASGPGR